MNRIALITRPRSPGLVMFAASGFWLGLSTRIFGPRASRNRRMRNSFAPQAGNQVQLGGRARTSLEHFRPLKLFAPAKASRGVTCYCSATSCCFMLAPSLRVAPARPLACDFVISPKHRRQRASSFGPRGEKEIKLCRVCCAPWRPMREGPREAEIKSAHNFREARERRYCSLSLSHSQSKLVTSSLARSHAHTNMVGLTTD